MPLSGVLPCLNHLIFLSNKMKRLGFIFSVINCISWATSIDIAQYLARCAPQVAASTMHAIIKTESKYNPLAINLNTKGKRLLYQAKNLNQAIAWVNYLESYGYNFDVGLGQINSKNIHAYVYKAHHLLDPCINLKVTSLILLKNYQAAKLVSKNEQEALLKALSAYNSGNHRLGFKNGYVNKVVSNASFPR